MNRTYLLVLLLGASLFAPAQTVVPPYNPDANGDSAIGAPDLLGLLPLFGTYFTPAEVMVDGQTLTEYIDALEEAAANANSDTVTIPMMPGTAPGQMLYWDGTDWTLVPVGQPGDALLLDGMVPEWRRLKTGCPDSLYLEYDPMATVDDGSCITLVVSGCTSPQYYEFEVEANVDDGSCATLDTTGCVPTVFDGHTYDVVEIGDQCWFAENLRTTTYRNGDVIPVGLTDGDWTSTSAGATAVYGEGSSGCYNYSPDIDACDEEQSLAEYGRLYNWYAVDDARGLCPVGWHVPTDEEWTDLEDFITAQGFSGTEGIALKSTYGWTEQFGDGNGTDDFGFSALPGGYRYFSGSFNDAGYNGYWWSSSLSGGDAWSRYLYNNFPAIYRLAYDPRFGFSVRCLRDADSSENQGCTDPAYTEYDASANTDDGSCSTLVLEGCTDPAYTEYDASANTDDGSCSTLVLEGCTDPAYTEYDASANTEDGSCSTLVYHDIVSCNEFEAPPGAVQSSSDNPCQVDWASANGDTIWHVIDNQGPVWDSPTLVVFEEGANCEELFTFDMANNPAVLPLMATDNCSDSCSYQVISTLMSGGCLVLWQREWTAYDFCGNESEVFIQLVQLVDDEEPAVFAPQDTTLFMQYDCGVEITPDLTGLAVVTDNCTNAEFIPEHFEGQDDLEGYLTFTDVVTPDPCSFLDSASSYTITRTWETLDYCNNIGTAVQVITIETGVSCESPTMDGHTYDVVEIGDQCWFAENLRTTVYGNGDVIPAGLTNGEWTSTTSGATAVYGEGSSSCYNYSPDIDACDEEQSLAEYGRLYNWYAVDDTRGLCPVGWHVPTDEEWTDLEDFITAQGFSGTVGTALKSTYGWYNGVNGTDDFWFSALPGGDRSSNNGYFDVAGSYGYWWSSSPSGGDAWYRYLNASNPDINRYNYSPRSGFSVRCLRDAD